MENGKAIFKNKTPLLIGSLLFLLLFLGGLYHINHREAPTQEDTEQAPTHDSPTKEPNSNPTEIPTQEDTEQATTHDSPTNEPSTLLSTVSWLGYSALCLWVVLVIFIGS